MSQCNASTKFLQVAVCTAAPPACQVPWPSYLDGYGAQSAQPAACCLCTPSWAALRTAESTLPQHMFWPYACLVGLLHVHNVAALVLQTVGCQCLGSLHNVLA